MELEKKLYRQRLATASRSKLCIDIHRISCLRAFYYAVYHHRRLRSRSCKLRNTYVFDFFPST